MCYTICESESSTLLFVASFFPPCIMFFINFSSQLRCLINCENRKNFAHRSCLYPMRLQKKNAPIRRVLFSSLHKVFHQFSCALCACKIVKTAKILLAIFVLYYLRIGKLNAPIRRVVLSSLHNVFHQFLFTTSLFDKL